MQIRDKELLRAFAAAPSVERFQPLLEHYVPFVYAAAYRQLGNEADATLAARAVFLAFARRLRGLSRRTLMVGWLFEAVRLTARKVKRDRERDTSPATTTGPASAPAAGDDTWARLSPLLDPALARLAPKYRNPVLLRFVLNWSLEDVAAALRRRPRRAEKRTAKGLKKVLARLRKNRLLIDAEALNAALSVQASATVLPPALASDILGSAQECFRRRPKLALARSTLRVLTWGRWKRLLKLVGATAGVFAVLIGVLVVSVILLWRAGWLLPRIIEFTSRWQLHNIPELAQPARPWPPDPSQLPSALSVRTADQLYRKTNIWLAHLRFSAEQWKALRPTRVPAVADFMQPDGTIMLRNTNATRNGVAGVLGFEFNWAHTDLDFSNNSLTNVAARLRGNGTYLSSLWGTKQPYKVNLDKFDKKQGFAGVRTLDFLNLVEDRSYMSDALGYELFREAGVPAPRTAYAWLTVSVRGQWDRKPLGLYLMVENVDADFAADRFGSRKVPIFKPVTPDLFKDLGDDWAAYARIYDLKTKATLAQKRRVIDFARLVTHADETEFRRRLGEFLDLDEFARFLAALVLVANYDSLLTYGQNYYMYLDPQADRFGFIPWDLDQAWGSFPQFGTAMARERASIWHPWTARNRFLERVLAVDEFRRLYKQHLEELLATAFRPERLYPSMDEIAPVIRGAIAAESSYRLRLFDQAVSTNWLTAPRDGGEGPDRPVHQIKRFIVNRAKSARDQLDGRSRGLILQPNGDWGK
jgi:DNA-directed RNA polymerase specialized sigma24 family protein